MKKIIIFALGIIGPVMAMEQIPTDMEIDPALGQLTDEQLDIYLVLDPKEQQLYLEKTLYSASHKFDGRHQDFADNNFKFDLSKLNDIERATYLSLEEYPVEQRLFLEKTLSSSREKERYAPTSIIFDTSVTYTQPQLSLDNINENKTPAVLELFEPVTSVSALEQETRIKDNEIEIVRNHLSDARLRINNDKVFFCSKYTLAVSSSHFASFFESASQQKNNIYDFAITPDLIDAFENLLRIFHNTNNKPVWTINEMVQMFQLIEHFQFSVEKFTNRFYENDYLILEDDSYINSLSALSYGDQGKVFIEDYFLTKRTLAMFPHALAAAKGLTKFHELSSQQIRVLIKSEHFTAKSENTVLQLLLAWANDEKNQIFLPDFLRYIRVQNITSEQIAILRNAKMPNKWDQNAMDALLQFELGIEKNQFPADWHKYSDRRRPF